MRIRKLNLSHEETFSYDGTVLEQTDTSVVLEAFFERYARLELGYTVFERGDRFVEYFYTDRWYNVFAVYAVNTHTLRGWYCNITRPALIESHQVSAVDLALDVWVNPDGSTVLLDEAEFATLPLAAEEVTQAWAAVETIKQLARERRAPFATET